MNHLIPHKPASRLSRQRVLCASVLLLLVGGLAYQLGPEVIASATGLRKPATASSKVAQAFIAVKNSDSYAFAADVVIHTIPLPTAGNIGRFSKTDSLYLEGNNDLHNKNLQMAMWGGGVSALDRKAAYQMKIEKGSVQTRAGEGEWKTGDTSLMSLAPDGDFLGFLDVAKNVKQAEEVNAAATDAELTQFTFDVDGHAYAAKMAQISQKQLERNGDLPAGAALQVPQQLQNMGGTGRLWVNALGLPVRQQVTLNMPPAPGSDTRSETVMDVHFSNYKSDAATVAITPLLQPLARSIRRIELPDAQTVAINTTMLAMGMLAVIATMHRGRRVKRIMHLTLLSSMLLSPVMQANAGTASLNKINTLRTKQAEAQKTNTAEKAVADARQSVVQAAPYAPAPAVLNKLAATSSTSSMLDSDGDGLTDEVEDMIGADPFSKDTDNDTISDFDEVNGFTYNNKKWYGNPLLADSNGDGAIDSLEWNPAAPDTDGDGTPDLYDFDDDGDGVPDNIDISRMIASKDNAGNLITFSETNPLTLTLDGLQTNRYTYVNLQVRPTNPKQLWYAFNVLNWPHDEKGNVQDWDNKTLYEYCVKTSAGKCHLSPDDNGDIKLVPMLEVAVSDASSLPRTSGGAIDKTLLGRYGISAQPSGNGGYLLYVPLNLVEDSTSGNKVAFSAQIIYQLASVWKPQQMRMSWVVQVLNESYASPAEADKAIKAGVGLGNDQLTILHAYYTDFQLTGLNVREDHGVDMGIVYEDPATDTNLNEEDALLHLTNGLDNSLLINRDCDFVDNAGVCVGDGQRDITIATLKTRFDRLSNSGTTVGQRWGIAQNRLRVETQSYAHEDEAVMQSGGQVAPAILNDHFSPTAAANASLLFVRETRFRANNLDVRAASTPTSTREVNWVGRSVQLSLSNINETVTDGYVLAPYQRSGNAWTRQLPSDYVKTLESRYPQTKLLASPVPTVTASTQASIVIVQVQAAQGNEMVTSQNGQTGLGAALSGNGSIGGLQAADITDAGLRDVYIKAATALGGSVPYLASNTMLKGLGLSENAWADLVNGILKVRRAKFYEANIFEYQLLKDVIGSKAPAEELASNLKKMALRLTVSRNLTTKTTKISIVGYRKLAVGPLLIGMVLGAILVNLKGAQTVGEIMLASLTAIVQTVDAVQSIRVVLADIASLPNIGKSALATVLSFRNSLSSSTAKAGAVGAVIGIVVTWSLFFAAWGKGGLSTDSIAFNNLVAGAIASTLVVVLTFLLSLSVVGAIVLAVFGIFDLIALIICKAGVKTACSLGITEAITKVMTEWIYTGAIMIDTKADPAITNIEDIKMRLARPDKGLVAGNSMRFDLKLLTVVRHAVPDPGIIYHYDNFFTPQDLQSTTVQYSLDKTERKLKVDLNQSPWPLVYQYSWVTTLVPSPVVGWLVPTNQTKNLYEGRRTDQLLSESYPFTQPKINQTFPLSLNVGLALPRFDCWFQVCVHKSAKSSSGTDLGSNFVLDILPATLDEFVNWAELGPQLDRDGDGLNSAQDPDSTNFDTDGDGLPDGVEYKYGTQRGYGFDPRKADADNDGLNDAEEIRYNTDPRKADTDGDGISDFDEVHGYTMTYAGRVAFVTSDPLQRDSDLDGMSDGVERRLNTLDSVRYPFNPHVFNDPPARVYTQLDDLDRVLASTNSLVVTTTVINGTDVANSLVAAGLFSASLPTELGGATQQKNFTLLADTSANIVLNGVAATGNHFSTIATGMAAELYPIGSSPTGAFNDIILNSPVPVTIDDDPPDAPSITQGMFVQPGRSVVIGGTSDDPTSYVSQVDVNVSNAGFISATGTALWAFPVTVPNTPNGNIPVSVRATDAVNHTNTVNMALTIDGISPNLSVDIAPGNIRQVRRNAAGNWVLRVNGTASDVTAGMASLSVQVGDSTNRVLTPTAIQANGAWRMDYEFDDIAFNADPRPTGPYTLTVVARDAALPDGNPTTQVIPFIIDMTPPVVSLLSHKSERQLTDGSVITGTVTDTYASVSNVEVAFVPAQTVLATERTLLRLPLNDLPQTVLFANKADVSTRIYCLDASCPTSGTAGADGTAATFDGNDLLRTFEPLSLPVSGTTTALWFSTTNPNAGLMTLVQGVYPAVTEHDRDLFLSGGKVCSDIKVNALREVRCSDVNTYADGQWHQVVHSLGANGNALFVDGQLAVSSPTTASTFSAQNHVLVGYAPSAAAPFLTGALDDVTIYDGAISAQAATSLYRQWRPVTVTNNTWSYAIPAGLEGYYQIDMRATDSVGNRGDDRGEWPKFRGPIDTQFPTFDLNVIYSGSGSAAQTTFTALVKDATLTTTDYSFVCALGDGQKQYDTTAALFGYDGAPSNQLTGINATCTQPGFQSSQIAVRACDAFGHCASGTPPQTLAYIGTRYNTLNPQGSLPNGIERTVLSDPKSRVQLIKRPGQLVTDIAIDETRGKIYWSEVTEGSYAQPAQIMRANLDGSGSEVLITGLTAYAAEALQIALDTVGNKIYYSKGYQLWWANLDGTLVQALYSSPDDPRYVGGAHEVNQIGDIAVDRANGKLYLSERRQRGDQAGYISGIRNFGQTFKHTLIVSTNLNGSNPTFVAGAGAGCTYANFYSNVGSGVGAGQQPILCLTNGTDGFDVESLTVSDGALTWAQIDADAATGSVYSLAPNASAVRVASLAIAGSNSNGLRLDPVPQLYVAPGSSAVFVANGKQVLRGEPAGEFTVFGDFGAAAMQIAGQTTRSSSDLTAMAALRTAQQLQTKPDLAIGITSPDLVLVNGQTGRYNVAFANNSAVPADSTSVTLTLPSGATFASASQSCTAAGLNVSCAVGRLAPFAQGTVAISFTIATNAVRPLTATVQIGTPLPDANATDNTASNASITAAPTLAALPGQPYIYGIDNTNMIRVPLLGTDHTPEPVFMDNNGVGGQIIGTDSVHGKLIINNIYGKIVSVAPNGTGYTVIGDANPSGTPINDDRLAIAVDADANRIYWTQIDTFYLSAIKSANLDGSDVRTVVPQVLNQRGLAIDLIRRKLLWVGTDRTERQNNIYISNLDGSGVEVAYAAPVGQLIRYLSINPYTQKLYWIDPTQTNGTLYWADSDGQRLAVLKDYIGKDARGIVVRPFADALYFISNSNLARTALDGSNYTELAAFDGHRYTGVSNLDPTVFPYTNINPPLSNLVLAYGTPFAPSACAAADGNEPNDVPAQATPKGIGTFTAALCRSTSSFTTFDHDVYSVTVPNGQQITVTLNPPADYNIYLQQGDVTVDASQQTGTTQDSVTYANYSGSPLDFTFTIHPIGTMSVKPYTVTVALATAPPQTTFTNAQCAAVDSHDAPGAAGNGSQANATPLTVGTPITGALCYKFDSDYYKFSGTAGQTLAVNLPVLPANYAVYVYRPNGILFNAYSTSGIPKFNTPFTLDATGDWAVAVVDTDFKSTLSQYQLLVSDVSCSITDSNEPNNSSAAATNINGQARVFATLCNAGDVDYYQFTASAGQQLTVNYPADGSSGNLVLQTAADATLGQIVSGTQRSFDLPSAGSYRLFTAKGDLVGNDAPYMFQWQLGAPTATPTTTAYVYYANYPNLVRVALSDDHIVEPILIDGGVSGEVLATSATLGKLYMIENGSQSLISVDFDGRNRAVIIANANPDGVGTLRIAVAVDDIVGRVYWLQPVGAVASTAVKLMSAKLDGSDVQQLVPSILDQRGLLVDPIKGVLYWVAGEAIYRSKLDGSNVQVIRAAVSGQQVRDLALDPYSQKLYWLDPSQQKLFRANNDGSGVVALASGLDANARGIALRPLDNELYFSNGASMMRSTLALTPTNAIAALSGQYQGWSNLNPNSFVQIPIGPPNSNLVIGQGQPILNPCTAADAREPNNTLATATALNIVSETVVYGALCNAVLAPTTDMDYFTVTVPNGKVLSATLSLLPADYRLVIIHPNNYAAAFSDNAGLADEFGVITNTSGNTLTYGVLVLSGFPIQNTDLYKLTLTQGDVPPPPNPNDLACGLADPNDAPGTGNGMLATATTLNFDTPIAGALCYANDVDMFVFAGLAGQSISIDLPTRPTDYALTLYAPGGAQTAISYGSRITLTDSGSYTVAVSQANLTPTTNQYQLLVSDNNCVSSDSYEPNNAASFGLADGSRVRATLCSNDDVDLYNINATAGQRLTINYPANVGGAALQIVGPSGSLGSASIGTQSQFTIPQSGLYTFSASNNALVAKNVPYFFQVLLGAPTSAPIGTPYIYGGRVSDLVRADVLSGTVEPILTDGSVTGGTVLAADVSRGKLYILDYLNHIARVNFDGSGRSNVVANINPNNVLRPNESLAVDELSGRIYWTEPLFGVVLRILSANGDGSDVRQIIPNVVADHGIAVDSVAGQLYWVETALYESQVVDLIRRSNLDGSAVQTVYAAPEGRQVRELAMDSFARNLYWRDPSQSKLLWLPMDGSGSPAALASVGNQSHGFVLRPLQNELYFTNDAGVMRAALNGSNAQELARLEGAYNGVTNYDSNVFYPTVITPPESNLVLGYGQPYGQPCNAVDSREPNDTLATAAPIGLGTISAALCTQDATRIDRLDFFSVTIAAGKQMTVLLSNLPLDYGLSLFTNGGYVANSYQSGLVDEQVTHVNTGTLATVYTILVQGFGETSRIPYSLTVTTGDAPPPPPPPPPPVDDCEAVDAYDHIGLLGNGSQGTPTLIGFNTPITAALCYVNDHDYYAFDGQIGQNVTIDLPVRPAHYYVTIYNPNGQYVNGIFPGSNMTYGSKLTLNATGRWKIAVWDPYLVQTTAQYQLRLSVNTTCSGLDPYEPNNDQFAGYTIVTRTFTLRSNLCELTDSDYYQIPVAVGDHLIITPRQLTPGMDMALQAPGQGFGNDRNGVDVVINTAGNFILGFYSQETTENLPYEIDIQVIPAPAPTPLPNNWTCATYTSSDVPRRIDDLATFGSTLNVPIAGTVTHVGIKDLKFNHNALHDLDFGLQAPDGSSVNLFNFRAYNSFYTYCGNSDCRFSLDDAAIAGLQPPQFPNTNDSYRPNAGSFGAFTGKPSNGVWTLLVSDNHLSDPNDSDNPDTTGNLTGWGLEICIANGQLATPAPTPTATATPVPQPTNGTPVVTAVLTATATPTPVPTTCTLTTDSYEPDNTTLTASAFNLANRSSGVRTFNSATDADWMTFSASANRQYQFKANVIGGDVRVSLAIYSSDGNTFIVAGDNAVMLPAGAGGSFLLRAKSGAGIDPPCGNNYSIGLNVIDPNVTPVPTPVGTPVPAGHTAPLISAAVITPVNGTVFSQTQPINLSIGLNTKNTVSAAAAFANGVLIGSFPPAPGSPITQSDVIWQLVWTPTQAGIYSLTVVMTDSTNATATSPVNVVFVDLANPSISIISETITTTKLSNGAYTLRGSTSDDSRVALVEVSLNGGAWQPAVLSGNAWTFDFSPQTLANPNGSNLSVNARVTDKAGRTNTATASMLVDVVPPDAFNTVTGLSSGEIISPSRVITDVNARLSWPAIPGASSVYAGWTTSPTPTLSALSAFGPGAGSRDQVLTQGTLWYAHVVAVDVNGNQRAVTRGPFYFDTAVTPDLIADLNFADWTASGGKQVAQGSTANNGVQSLFVGWDATQLRLRWDGANISNDGDLYFYLGTGSTGSTTLFNPNGASQSGVLPFAANYVVRLAGGITPTLYAFNGTAWVAQMQVSALSSGSTSDVLLAFADLGIANPAGATLKLLGVATEKDNLTMWATAPDKNLGRTWNQFVSLASLGAGVVPAAGVWADAQLEVVIAANPPPAQLVGVGDVVSVTLSAKNIGTALLPSLTMSGATAGGIVLNNAAQSATNIAVSGTAVLTLTGIVNANGAIALTLADSYNRPYQLETLAYRVDITAPVNVGIAISYAIIGRNVVFVSAQDDSEISRVDLEINGVIGSASVGLLSAGAGSTCTAVGTGYQCAWDVGNVAEGTLFTLRAIATDNHGNAAWSSPISVRVDATPPRVTLSAASLAALSDGRLSNKERALSGTLTDTVAAGSTKLCSDDVNSTCASQDALPNNTWSLTAPDLGDGVTTTLSFIGYDLAGNSSQVISVTVLVDSVGPQFGATTFNPAVTTSSSAMVLGNGTVTDGGGVAGVQLFVVRPNGSSTSVAATLNGTAWAGSFVFDQNGVYQVIAVATDLAGNKTTQVLGEITATGGLVTPIPTTTPPPVTATPTVTPRPTATQEVPSPSPTVLPSASATAEPAQTMTPSPTQTKTPAATVMKTMTPSPTQTKTPAATVTKTMTPSPTQTKTPAATVTKTMTPSPTQTKTPFATKTATPTATPLVQVCVGNLLQNWSFELPLVAGQHIQFWVEQPKMGSVRQGTGYAADGVNSAFIGSNKRLYQDVTAAAKQVMSLTFWAGTQNRSQSETVQLQFLNAAGNAIAQQSAAINHNVNNDTSPPRLKQYTLTAKAPTGTVKVRVLGRNDGNAIFWLDAVCLKGHGVGSGKKR